VTASALCAETLSTIKRGGLNEYNQITLVASNRWFNPRCHNSILPSCNGWGGNMPVFGG